jgi:hypothetical protein
MNPEFEPKWPSGVKGRVAKLFLGSLIFLSWWVAFDIASYSFSASHPHPLPRLFIGVAIVLWLLLS